MSVQSPESSLPAIRQNPGGAVASVTEMRARQQAFNDFVKSCLRDGHDFGTIPGTEKQTLLKPGAEKLCLLYGLTPKFTIVDRTERWGDEAFFFYLVRCELVSRSTGEVMSEGLGSCSSHESKYRWRTEWWNGRNTPPEGQGWFQKRTRNGMSWMRRVPNPDPADLVNTMLKMAKKRAHIDATLTATAASEFFNQDLDDLDDAAPSDASASGDDGHAAHGDERAHAAPAAPAAANAPARPATPPPPGAPTQGQLVVAIRQARTKMNASDADAFSTWFGSFPPGEAPGGFRNESEVWGCSDTARLAELANALSAAAARQ